MRDIQRAQPSKLEVDISRVELELEVIISPTFEVRAAPAQINTRPGLLELKQVGASPSPC
jgi:hypothetical protein